MVFWGFRFHYKLFSSDGSARCVLEKTTVWWNVLQIVIQMYNMLLTWTVGWNDVIKMYYKNVVIKMIFEMLNEKLDEMM